MPFSRYEAPLLASDYINFDDFFLVYPPSSMYLPDLGFSDDETFFGGLMTDLMTDVSPVSTHLKTVKFVEEDTNIEVGDDAEDVGIETVDEVPLRESPADADGEGRDSEFGEKIVPGDPLGEVVVEIPNAKKRRLRKKVRAQRHGYGGGGSSKACSNEEDQNSFVVDIARLFGESYEDENFKDFYEGNDGGQKIAHDLGVSAEEESEPGNVPLGDVVGDGAVSGSGSSKRKARSSDDVDSGVTKKVRLGEGSELPGKKGMASGNISGLTKVGPSGHGSVMKTRLKPKGKRLSGGRKLVEYVVSSEEDEVEDVRGGGKRKGVGYLFSTGPKGLMTQFLGSDDKLKLGRCKLDKKVKKLEKHVDRVSHVELVYSVYWIIFCYC